MKFPCEAGRQEVEMTLLHSVFTRMVALGPGRGFVFGLQHPLFLEERFITLGFSVRRTSPEFVLERMHLSEIDVRLMLTPLPDGVFLAPYIMFPDRPDVAPLDIGDIHAFLKAFKRPDVRHMLLADCGGGHVHTLQRIEGMDRLHNQTLTLVADEPDLLEVCPWTDDSPGNKH